MNDNPIRVQVRAALQRGRPDLAFDRIAELLITGGDFLAEQWEAHALLPHVVQRVSATTVTAARQASARQLGVELPELRRSIGRAEFPAVGRTCGRFVAVRVSVGHREDEIYPNELPAETRAATIAALSAARAKAADDQHLRVDFECGEEIIYGGSCGLAVGMAALSYLERLPLPESFLFSGQLQDNGRLVAISCLDEKVALRRECRPGAVLVVPADHCSDDINVLPAATLLEVLTLLGVDGETDLENELRAVHTEYSCGRWPAAARLAQRLLPQPGLRVDELMLLRTILLAAANHRGDQGQAAEQAASMRLLLADPSVSPQLAALALANAAIQAIDLLRPAEAAALLAQAMQLPLEATDPSWVHLRGTLARVRIFQGDLAEALALRRQNAQTCPAAELARCLGDLADGYLRSGEFTLAEGALRDARRTLASLRSSRRRLEYHRQTESYLTLYEVRLRRARDEPEHAQALLVTACHAPATPTTELRIEAALLEPSLAERLIALDKIFSALPESEQLIFRALQLRARLLAGDTSAQPELTKMLGQQELDAAALCGRLPY